jgi:hypothetical protein
MRNLSSYDARIAAPLRLRSHAECGLSSSFDRAGR